MLAFNIFLFTGTIVTTPSKTTLAHFRATIQTMPSLQSLISYILPASLLNPWILDHFHITFQEDCPLDDGGPHSNSVTLWSTVLQRFA